ncbi:hypothetical protein, partial [Pseudomonas aeruginosa]
LGSHGDTADVGEFLLAKAQAFPLRAQTLSKKGHKRSSFLLTWEHSFLSINSHQSTAHALVY